MSGHSMYTIVELPGLITSPPNAPLTYGLAMPKGINGKGDAVGWSASAPGPNHAVVWRNGIAFDLGTIIPGPANQTSSEAHGINDHGVIVGACYDNVAHPPPIAFRWRQGKMEALPVPEGYAGAFANSINAKGDICGWIGRLDFGCDACVWYANGQTRILSVPPTASAVLGYVPQQWRVYAHSINDAGEVLIVLSAATGNVLFVWNGSWTIIPTQNVPGGAGGEGAINNLGLVVGGGFWWEQIYGEHLLPTFGSKFDGVDLFSVTSTGLAVGAYSVFLQQLAVACAMQLPMQGFVDLNTILPKPTSWYLETAQAANEHGTIVGQGTNNGHPAVWLLTPKLSSWLSQLLAAPYAPPRKLPTHILPGDPGPAEARAMTPALLARRALEYAARLMEGADRREVEAIAARLRDNETMQQ